MKRVPIYQLAPHQVQQLLAANRQVDLARQRMTELVLLLIGPKALGDPTLELDFNTEELTVVRQIELEEE